MSYRRILNLVNLWATWRVVKKVFKVKVMKWFCMDLGEIVVYTASHAFFHFWPGEKRTICLIWGINGERNSKS